MKKYYKISIQFADPSAPDFDDATMTVINRAISYYNEKSRMARNPKQITKTMVIDKRTLEIILESDSELPYPGKALRLFSLFLIDSEIDGAFSRFVYGKNLLKMISEEISEESETKPAAVESEEINAMRIRAISLMLSASEETLRKVINLVEEV